MDGDTLIENSNIDFVIFRVAYALYVLWAGLESKNDPGTRKISQENVKTIATGITLLNDAVSYNGVLETSTVSALSVTETISY
jgi:hypothetical protein